MRARTSEFFNTKKGVALIIVLVMVGTWFFNKLLNQGSIIFPLVLIVIIGAASWIQRANDRRTGRVEPEVMLIEDERPVDKAPKAPKTFKGRSFKGLFARA